MKRIHLVEEECVQCGACSSVCNSNALYLEKSSWNIVYVEKKCVGCLVCIKACPSRAIKAEIMQTQPSVAAEPLN